MIQENKTIILSVLCLYFFIGATNIHAEQQFNMYSFIDKKYAESDYFYKIGFNYQTMEEYGEAIKYYTKAIEIIPIHARAYIKRGEAYLRIKDYYFAIADFDRVIEINPMYFEAYLYRGIANVRQRQYDNAISDFNRAIKMRPEFAVAYSNRGYTYYLKGEYKKALWDVNKAKNLGHQVQPEFLKALSESARKDR